MNCFRRLAIVIIIILLVSGCAGQTIIFTDSYITGQDSQYWYKANTDLPMADTKEGYYFMNGQFLYYRDKESGKIRPVCSKPECLHKDDTCNAYLPKIRTLIYYLGKLYYLQDGFFNPDESDKDTLCEMNIDGSAHKEVLTFPNYVYQVAIHRDYIYYITTDFGTIPGKEDAAQTSMGFYRSPLKRIKTKPELLYMIKGIHANAGALLCYGNYIYFYQSSFTDASMVQKKRQINRYSIKEKSIDILPNCDGAQYTIFNDKFGYSSSDGTYLCDLDGGNNIKITDRYGVLLPSTKYLLIDTVFDYDVLDRKTPRTINAYDNEGSYMGSVQLNGFRPSPIGVVDDVFIFPSFDEDTQCMTIYSIPVYKIADGTGSPEIFFPYSG